MSVATSDVPLAEFRSEKFRFTKWNFILLQEPSKNTHTDEIKWDVKVRAQLSDVTENKLTAIAIIETFANIDKDLVPDPIFRFYVQALGEFSLTTPTQPEISDLPEFVKKIRINGLSHMVANLRPTMRSFCLDASGLEIILPALNLGSLDDTEMISAFESSWQELVRSSSPTSSK